MKLIAALLACSSTAAAGPCLVAPPPDGVDARVTVASDRVTFCPRPDACKTFPLKGLRGSPPEPPHVYLNKAGTLGAFRWLANDTHGWHMSLRLYNVATGKQLVELTAWKAGGFVHLTNDRIEADRGIYDATGNLLGRVDKSRNVAILAPDETVELFVDTHTGAFELVDLATAKPKASATLPDWTAQVETAQPKFALASDGKTAWGTAGAWAVSIDLASGKASRGTAPAACP